MDESAIAMEAPSAKMVWPSPTCRWVLVVFGLLLLVPLLVPVVTPRDARLLLYPYGAVLYLLAMGFSLALALRHQRRVRVQWMLLAAQFAMLSVSLWAPTLHLFTGWPGTRVTAWLISGFASASFMFCLLPLSALSGRGSRVKRVLDAIVTLILCGLNFLTAFSTGPSGFSHYHLQVSFATVIFLLLAAEATRRSTVAEAERQFTGILTAYLVSRVVTLFLVNIVNYVLLKTPRELPFDLFYGLPQLSFCVMTFYQLQVGPSRSRLRTPSALWASVVPSILFSGSVLLALHVVTEYPVVGSLSIGMSVVCFILGTHLMYRRMLREQQELIVRTGQLETLASHDALTGIGNRRWFEAMATEVLRDGPAALLLIDTDRFKWINDTFGHRAGDELLAGIGEAIQDEMSAIEGACCARIGGDEFAVLLPDTGSAMAQGASERLRRRIAGIRCGSPDCHSSVSIGIAAASGPVPLSSLLELADEALYRAKDRGRNVVEVEALDAVVFARRGQHSEKRLYRGNS